MATLEERVSRLEGVLEQMSERLGSIERQIAEHFSEIKRRFEAFERRQDEQFRWLVGLIVIQWVTVLAAVLGALLTR